MIIESKEYLAIARVYGERTARRSGVPLIRHIDHGLAILTHLARAVVLGR